MVPSSLERSAQPQLCVLVPKRVFLVSYDGECEGRPGFSAPVLFMTHDLRTCLLPSSAPPDPPACASWKRYKRQFLDNDS